MNGNQQPNQLVSPGPGEPVSSRLLSLLRWCTLLVALLGLILFLFSVANPSFATFWGPGLGVALLAGASFVALTVTHRRALADTKRAQRE